jgi:hypothetical protein
MPLPLFSMNHIAESGHELTFGKYSVKLLDPHSKELFRALEKNGIYIIPLMNEQTPTISKSNAMIILTLMQLHRCLRHIYTPAAIQLVKEHLIDGIKLAPRDETNFCKACVKAKHSCKSFLKEHEGKHNKEYGKLIYSDV